MNCTEQIVASKSLLSDGVNIQSESPVQQVLPVASPPVQQTKPPVEMQVDKAEGINMLLITKSADQAVVDANDEDIIMVAGKVRSKKTKKKRKELYKRTLNNKLRHNRQLRRSMPPKNALRTLNELEDVQISDFTIYYSLIGWFTAVVTVNNVKYEGKGHSKMDAKNHACERALRDYLIEKMAPKPLAIKEVAEPMDTSDKHNAETKEDDALMLNLASFAIYKLFEEWKREGHVVPEMLPTAADQQTNPSSSSAPLNPKKPKEPPVRTELPCDWESMHPATLLCVMRPGLLYIDYGIIGEEPNFMRRLGIIVDNQEFSAFGRSKKIARRAVAAKVCNTLFRTNFRY